MTPFDDRKIDIEGSREPSAKVCSSHTMIFFTPALKCRETKR